VGATPSRTLDVGLFCFTAVECHWDYRWLAVCDEYLSKQQNRKLYTHPDMVWQFARYVKELDLSKGKNVAVFANIQVKLNDRPYQTFIDPSIDLGSVEWQHFQAASWILPMEKE